MDILQNFSPVAQAGGTFIQVSTGLYSKLSEPCFQRLNPVQYTHASSCVSRQCLANVCVSQLCRYLRIITDQRQLVSSVGVLVRKLAAQGHLVQGLWHKIVRFVLRHPLRFAGLADPRWFLEVLRYDFMTLGYLPPPQLPLHGARCVRRRRV